MTKKSKLWEVVVKELSSGKEVHWIECAHERRAEIVLRGFLRNMDDTRFCAFTREKVTKKDGG